MVQEFKQLKEIEKTRLKEKEEYEKVQTNRLTS